ncbi:MAG TPA: GntR family transcriptional regulator [Candidatus Sulfotelmatobacter sp.]|nr:GntR family transcriptional regulator [Candidatus Sulfotelmatobacter sp.]
MQPLGPSPVLIDQVYDRLVEAIADGTLAPGQRIRQEALAELLGVSRQPVSHALQLLKRQRLVEEHGKRGLVIAGIDAGRILALYQVRAALDALAAREAARTVARGSVGAEATQAAERALADGRALGAGATIGALIQADVAFHVALYRLAGNPVIEDTVASQWPHLKRSMGVALGDPDQPALVWSEHAAILARVLAGDADGAERAARDHALRAGTATARRLTTAADAA